MIFRTNDETFFRIYFSCSENQSIGMPYYNLALDARAIVYYRLKPRFWDMLFHAYEFFKSCVFSLVPARMYEKKNAQLECHRLGNKSILFYLASIGMCESKT